MPWMFSHFLPLFVLPHQQTSRLWRVSEFCCPRRAQPPSLCGRRSPTTHLLDLYLYGHSRPSHFRPPCSIPHRERPLLLMKEVDKFYPLPEESSPLWWWLIVPGVAHCPCGIYPWRRWGWEDLFFFLLRYLEWAGQGWLQHMRLCSCHSSIIVLKPAWGRRVFCQNPFIYL